MSKTDDIEIIAADSEIAINLKNVLSFAVMSLGGTNEIITKTNEILPD